MDYAQADRYLGKKQDRPLKGRSTRMVRREPGAIAIRYHATDVVTFYSDGRFTLDSGGYRSATTKARMREYAPVAPWQAKGLWYIGDAIYADGATFDPLHGWSGLGPDRLKVEKAKRTLDRDVKAYIKGYAAHALKAGKVADPSGGDCWGCFMRPVGAPTREGMGYDHYVSHLADGYYVPSLLRNAILARGYNNPGFIWQMINARLAAKDALMLIEVLRAFFRNLKPHLLSLRELE